MARAQSPDSAGCQFFVCHGDAAFLDRQYTAFGKLAKGEDTLEKIASTPCRAAGERSPSRPVQRVHVESITIVPRSSIA
jgi:peptidyl-prolyl cis-trans isomerase B (cyclophilin B)